MGSETSHFASLEATHLLLAVSGTIPRLISEFFWEMRHGFRNFGESLIFSFDRRAGWNGNQPAAIRVGGRYGLLAAERDRDLLFRIRRAPESRICLLLKNHAFAAQRERLDVRQRGSRIQSDNEHENQS